MARMKKEERISLERIAMEKWEAAHRENLFSKFLTILCKIDELKNLDREWFSEILYTEKDEAGFVTGFSIKLMKGGDRFDNYDILFSDTMSAEMFDANLGYLTNMLESEKERISEEAILREKKKKAKEKLKSLLSKEELGLLGLSV